MSNARLSLQKKQKDINEALESLINNPSRNTAIDRLFFNGLTVSTFVIVEQFIRERTNEVLSTIGSRHKFQKLPEKLQYQIVQGTLAGIGNSLPSREIIGDGEKTNEVLFEIIMMNDYIDKDTFEVSEYVFGRSSSNIGKNHISELIGALLISGGIGSLDKLHDRLLLPTTEKPSSFFRAMALSRHKAAHSFLSEYTPSDLLSKVRYALPLFCFCFDAAICWAAHSIEKSIVEQRTFQDIKVDDMPLRRFIFTNPAWIEYRNEHEERTVNNYAARLNQFKSSKAFKDEKWLSISNNIITDWGGFEY